MRTLHPARPLTPRAYDATIVAAELTAYAWRRTEQNPDGIAVRAVAEVVADDGEPAHIVDAVDITNRGRLGSLFGSAGRTLRQGDDLGEQVQSLVDSRCRVVVKNIRPNTGVHAGKEKACVSAWIVTSQGSDE